MYVLTSTHQEVNDAQPARQCDSRMAFSTLSNSTGYILTMSGPRLKLFDTCSGWLPVLVPGPLVCVDTGWVGAAFVDAHLPTIASEVEVDKRNEEEYDGGTERGGVKSSHSLA